MSIRTTEKKKDGEYIVSSTNNGVVWGGRGRNLFGRKVKKVSKVAGPE